ncbi:putative disease resistance RPP13-like protein 1 [Vitis riparia]|uniref:putative disease resistance RPP13-like protein 1 n=1 Tax=Vitis riparia TaxID=96939 RepID=UPI00155A10FF|nr:putative disease resistance RPP13-like protein 1 [Vitis riparia]XP_034701749.1 putative disease resistance RPP13-like protein 1 [Vitis riparia]XP_034701750.1 putative disease resistance RPP13-like protein 1 [Vitis riparia]XP_034701751.1 putative disease resistance RPP13-like protein 1 [Vitis riparia]XP_034701752.1 putative disease resistance RPP13-like protein 1 [Vitis riparia]XP_034701753.1 putative disease resistance RPP13-like protein 1 [Vitis riparia]XP_034701754.1 putative disease res
MALALVGGAFLSASLQVLFDRLASSEVLNFIRGQKLSDSLLSKLRIKLLIVDAVLNHAEVKQFTDPAVKEWLLHVKGTLYDAEDLLDEIATEALRCKMEADDHSQTGSAKVWNSISTWVKAPLANYRSSIESRVKEMIGKLEVLEKAIDKLGLKPGDGEKLPPRSPSTSLVDESCVFGRNEIKEEMMTRLLSDNVSTNKIDVISVVGMGGAGKTTLAQLLYNDAKVEELFDLKAWVCVSEEFLLVRVTKLILEGIGCATPSDMQTDNLDLLQLKLKGSLGDKKFLLVLDDVWEKGCSEWHRLRIPLLAAGKGSKVVVTTRSTKVAEVMQAVHPHYSLGELSADGCWSLFTKLAFENGDSTAFPQLASIGRKIVAKCQGLPLAVKALGSLLHSKVDKREWEKILESEIWGWQNLEILPSLILSYHDLPLHLKRCFAYCSIFPKDHEFNREKLILLWMAEGFLRDSQSNERMEEVGDLYFHELLSKSFFHRSATNESCFVMHDLIHDLAQYISGEFCVRLEDDKVQKITEKAHHLFHVKSAQSTVFKKFESLTEVKCLPTFGELDTMQLCFYALSKRVLHDILPKMRSLRVLSLRYYNIEDLPDSIGKLIYLRYLDLSYTLIKRLPDSVCYLYNLQTMILLGCNELKELPSRIGKLINLRHLNFSYHKLSEMPSHVGQLKSLQQLTKFIVGQKSGLRICELGELSDIRGTLDISNMENVACAKDALQANMKDKKHLDKLALNWSDEIADGVVQSGVIDHVLNNLQPHPNLKRFKITNYPGIIFPDWLGDPSFSNLLRLKLWDCENCSSLPPLGLLPSLQHLCISGMPGIERVGSEFYRGASSSNTIKTYFRSLQTLRFECMYKWEKWLRCGCRPGEFPRLQELYIIDCPKLTGKLPKQLRCLKKLEIDGCPQLLVASLKVPAISELRMRNFGKLRLKRPASGFTALQTSHIQISDVSPLKQLPFGPHHKLTITECDAVESLVENRILQTNLCYLKFLRCCFSRSLEKCDLSSTLQSLNISGCNKVEFLLPELLRCHLPFLQTLRIYSCTCESLSLSFSLAVFPSLTHLQIENLEGLEFLTISISEGDPASLNYLAIEGCPNLVYIELPALDSACYKISECLKLKLLAHTPSSLRKLELGDCPELLFRGLPSNLCELKIRNCNKLTPEVDWGLQRMASLTHLEIVGGCEDVESFPKDCLLPSGLTSLQIIKFPKLKSLDSKGLQRLTSLTTLYIGACPELQFFAEEWFQHFSSLVELNISGCDKLQSLTGSVFQHLTSLQRLHIRKCPEFQFLSGLQHLTSLQRLHIRMCPGFQFLSGLQHLTSLIELQILGCSGLQSLTELGLQSLASLKLLDVSDFPQLQSLTQAGLQHLTSLETLSIQDCPKLQYLTKERLPDSLCCLTVKNCPLLEQRCQFEKGQEWCYIAHIPQVQINGVLM